MRMKTEILLSNIQHLNVKVKRGKNKFPLIFFFSNLVYYSNCLEMIIADTW